MLTHWDSQCPRGGDVLTTLTRPRGPRGGRGRAWVHTGCRIPCKCAFHWARYAVFLSWTSLSFSLIMKFSTVHMNKTFCFILITPRYQILLTNMAAMSIWGHIPLVLMEGSAAWMWSGGGFWAIASSLMMPSYFPVCCSNFTPIPT